MRQVLEPQRYLDFTSNASPKIVAKYRRKYELIDQILEENPVILWLVHDDLEKLSDSNEGREAKYTTEILFRALLVHQIEKTSLRATVIRIAESETLRKFVRLGNRPVMDFTFLDRAFKVITSDTWKVINYELGIYAVKEKQLDVSRIRTDSTVIESNIHYPTDSSLLWDSYRVLSRLLRTVRDASPTLCQHRFHDRKVKKDLVYVNRYMKSGSTARQREKKKRFRRLLENVRRVEGIAAGLVRPLLASSELALVGIGHELKHYIPLVRTVCSTAERAGLKGETVPASERIFSIFEDHAELIKRGKSHKPVEFGHSVWLAQSPDKFITDYDVMEQKIPDADLLPEIVARHKASYKVYPNVLAADTGFRADAEEMAALEKIIDNVAVPGRGLSRKKIETWLHHFRAGIEGSISVLKRAFRLMICMYRGFKSFSSAVGMAVFCHNLVNLIPKRASA